MNPTDEMVAIAACEREQRLPVDTDTIQQKERGTPIALLSPDGPVELKLSKLLDNNVSQLSRNAAASAERVEGEEEEEIKASPAVASDAMPVLLGAKQVSYSMRELREEVTGLSNTTPSAGAASSESDTTVSMPKITLPSAIGAESDEDATMRFPLLAVKSTDEDDATMTTGGMPAASASAGRQTVPNRATPPKQQRSLSARSHSLPAGVGVGSCDAFYSSSSGSETPSGLSRSQSKSAAKSKKPSYATRRAIRVREKRKTQSLPRNNPGLRPDSPGGSGAPPMLNLPVPEEEVLDLEEELRRNGVVAQLTYENQVFTCTRDHWIDLKEVGRGAFGNVRKMRHTLLNKVFAVKQLRDSIDKQSRGQLITDLDVIRKSECQWIVQYYGFCCTEGEMWIYMEHMMVSLDRMYKTFLENRPQGDVIPEKVMGVIAVSVLRGLDYLYETHSVMHRDVKPSNILVGFDGSIRVCDFGVSTFMVKSIARTHAGSERYLPPERAAPNQSTSENGYGLTSDVWAYGLTLLETACLDYPYPKHPFQRVMSIVQDEPPRIPDGLYSPEFCDLIALCLTKEEPERPYYRKPAKNSPEGLCLIDHVFIIHHGKLLDSKTVDMVGWWQSIQPSGAEE